uniref:Uncharacterized protein n=1 Tax=Arundo donax TaxID=35708 RepID=A0A0A9GNV5_ARUDO
MLKAPDMSWTCMVVASSQNPFGALCLHAVKISAAVGSIQNYIDMITERAHMLFHHIQLAMQAGM